MKIIKRLLLLFSVGVVTLAAALLFVAANIDPNDYKEEIQTAVQQATGRKLTIEGNVGLTLFPALSLDIQDASLGNPPGIEGRLASVERALARLALLPLLQKRLEIGKITLRKPQLDLHTLSDGRTNWKDLAAQDKRPPPEIETGAGVGAFPPIAGLSLAGVSIEDAVVTWRDERTGEDLQVNRLNLETGALAAGKPVEVGLDGVVHDKRRGFSADLELDAEVSADLQNRRVHVGRLAVATDFRGYDGRTLDAKVNAAVEIDLGGERAEIRGLSADVAGMRIEGGADVAGLSGEARISLTLKSENLAPRVFVDILGGGVLGVPADHWPERAKLELDAVMDLGKDSGRIKKMVVSAGGARVESEGTISGLFSDTRRISAKISSNAFDPRTFAEAVNLKLPETAGKQAFGKFSVSGGFSAVAGTDEASAVIRNAEIALDDSRLHAQGGVAFSPTLNADLTVGLDRVDAGRYFPPGETKGAPASLQVSDLRARIRAADRSLSASEVTAKVFGGNFDGAFSFDADERRPVWRSRGKATGVKIEQLLAALAVKDAKALKGKGTLAYELTAAGRDEESLIRSLAGSLKIKIEKGAFRNPRLARNIEQVVAFFEQRPPAGAGEELLFHDVAASFSLKEGAAVNRDLEVHMPLLHLRGAGRADYAASRIDYRLRAGLLKQPPARRLYIPINVSGAFDAPEYSVDLEEALRKRLQKEAEEAKQRLKKKIGEEKERLREKAAEKIEEILKEKLKLPF